MNTATSSLAIAWVLTAFLMASTPGKTPEAMLEAAIYRAKVLGDLAGAAEQFESIAERYKGKPVAAQALVELGQVEELLGHRGRAHQAYMRVLRNYPDQVNLVARVVQNAESLAEGIPKAKGVNWASLNGSAAPSARCCAAMAYDPATHETLFYGGFTPYVCFGDTWMWRNGWRQLSPATSPSARTGAGMVFDGAAGNVVLFGGFDSAGKSLGDTWTWDGITWTEQHPPVSPPGRRFDPQGMVYDAAIRRVVFFGGASGARALADTWMWDGVAKTWTQQFPAASPSARRTVLAYDEGAKVVILFGGHTGGPLRKDTFFKDTWSWDGVTWTQRPTAAGPSPRGMDTMMYDAGISAVVLFGGVGNRQGPYNDTWVWDRTNWQELHSTGAPGARWNMAASYDPSANGIVLFGGFGLSMMGDTWLMTRVP